MGSTSIKEEVGIPMHMQVYMSIVCVHMQVHLLLLGEYVYVWLLFFKVW